MTKTVAPNSSFRHEWIPLDRLTPHPDIQRSFVRAHAEAIASKFDPDSFGELYVVKDNRGYLIWDGQHRAWAARKALGDDQSVYCRVYENEEIAKLADRSLKLNTQKAWTPIDRYRLRVKAGEWRARTIHGTLHQYGLKVGNTSDEGTVRAVVACDWIMEKAGGPGMLHRVVGILFKAWGADPNAYHNNLLRGMALFCGRYGDAIVDEDLADKIQKSGGPARMVGRARDRAKVNAQTVPHAAAEIFVNEYNKSRSKNRLPAWG